MVSGMFWRNRIKKKMTEGIYLALKCSKNIKQMESTEAIWTPDWEITYFVI